MVISGQRAGGRFSPVGECGQLPGKSICAHVIDEIENRSSVELARDRHRP